MRDTIGYHTRLWQDNTVKISGGSFGGRFNMETVEQLVKTFFTVVVKRGGAVFLDRHGREVTLYVSVDAGKTTAGIAALKEWHKEQSRREQEAQKRAEAQEAEVSDLMAGLTHEEIVQRLKGENL